MAQWPYDVKDERRRRAHPIAFKVGQVIGYTFVFVALCAVLVGLAALVRWLVSLAPV